MHFTDLAKSVGASATSAATAGVSYTELAAAQATLTNVGKNAESASQNLNSLIMGMIAPTSAASKEAKKLGIEWNGQALKAHGLSYMINEAVTATHGNSEELKKLLPNQRAYMAVLALGENAHKQYTDTLNKMKDAHGATAKALEETEKGTGESIDKMKTELTNAGIQLVQGLAPALSSVADKVQELTKWFSSLSPHTQKIAGEVALGAAAFLTLGSAFFMTLSGIGALIKGFEGIQKAFSAMSVLLEANPMILAITAIVAVVAIAAYEIYAHWDQVKKWLTEAWTAISSTAKSVWNGIAGFFKQWGTTLLAIFIPVIGLPILIAQHWNQIIKFAHNIFNATINGIKNIWNGAINWIKGAGKSFANAIVTAFQWMYNHNYYFKDLVDFIQNAWNTITNDAITIWNGFVNILTTVWTVISTIATAFWNREVNGFKNTWNGIVSVAKIVWNGLSSFFSGLWNGISSGVSNAWGAIKGTISNLVTGAVNALKGPFNTLGNFFSGLWGEAKDWGANLIKMVAKGITNTIGDVENAVQGVAKGIAKFLGFHSPSEAGPGADADKWMPNLMNMFVDGIQTHVPNIQAAIGNVALGLKAGVSMPLSQTVNQMALPGGSGGGNVYNITVNANGNITRNEKELGDIVSRAIFNKAKMQGRI